MSASTPPSGPCVPRRLERSVAASWRRSAQQSAQRWSTTTGFYATVARMLETVELDGITRDLVIENRITGRGGSTAFYTVTGPSAKGLRAAYSRGTAGWHRDVAALFPEHAIHNLAAEAKVWSYWDTRRQWVQRLDEHNPAAAPEPATQDLIRALTAWARSEPGLAAAADHMPPLCAVEDLVIVQHALLPPATALDYLREVVRGGLASGPEPAATGGAGPVSGALRPPAPYGAGRAERIARVIRMLEEAQLPDVAEADRRLAIEVLAKLRRRLPRELG